MIRTKYEEWEVISDIKRRPLMTYSKYGIESICALYESDRCRNANGDRCPFYDASSVHYCLGSALDDMLKEINKNEIHQDD